MLEKTLSLSGEALKAGFVKQLRIFISSITFNNFTNISNLSESDLKLTHDFLHKLLNK